MRISEDGCCLRGSVETLCIIILSSIFKCVFDMTVSIK